MRIPDPADSIGNLLSWIFVIGFLLILGMPFLFGVGYLIKKIFPILLIVFIAFMVIKLAGKKRKEKTPKTGTKQINRCIRCGHPVVNKNFRYCSRCWKRIRNRKRRR